MPLCRRYLSSWRRWALVHLIVFFFLMSVILYNYYIEETHSTYITENVNIAGFGPPNMSKNDCLLAPPGIVNASFIAKQLGLRPVGWIDKPVINPFQYGFVHNPCTACASKSIEVFIGVLGSRTHFNRRQTIRETWGEYVKDPDNRAVLLFFLGNKSVRETVDIPVQKRIDEESAQHNDIVQGDFVDNYRNLSLKSMSILRWIDAYCPQADFIVKADNDMYIAVPRLVQNLKEVSQRVGKMLFIIGSKIAGAWPVRKGPSKWYTTEEQFSERQYPIYASGTSYSMTGKTSRMLLRAALRTPLFWLEDIYITGLCSRTASILVLNDSSMTNGKPIANGCTFRSFTTGHGYTIREIRKIHKELYDPNLNCNVKGEKTKPMSKPAAPKEKAV